MVGEEIQALFEGGAVKIVRLSIKILTVMVVIEENFHREDRLTAAP